MSWEIRQGDCLEIMRGMTDNSVDSVITDPPYDKRTHDGAVHYTATKQISNDDLGIDDFEPMLDPSALVREFLRISKRWCLAFCTFEDIKKWRDEAWKQKAWVRAGVWDRVTVTPQFSGDRPAQACDGIAIFHRYTRKHWNGGGKSAIWRCRVEYGMKEHPIQKPLALIKQLVCQFTDPEETILDPFCGSGTTGVACIQTGRNFIGIEIDHGYAEIARERCRIAEMQLRLPLDGTP